MTEHTRDPVLNIRHDTRYECEGAVAELHEGSDQVHLTHSTALREGRIDTHLTRREVVALASVLMGADKWLRNHENDVREVST